MFQLARVVVLAPEAGDEHGVAVEDPLIGEIVDGVDRRRPVERLQPFHGVDVDGNEARLPIVAMNDVGEESQRLAELERAARQVGEPFEIVRITVTGWPVKVGAIEVAVVLEAVDGHVGLRQPAHADPAARRAPPHGDREQAVEHLEIVPGHAGVERHHHPYVHVQGAQRFRQRAHHVGETAGLRERRDLGGDEQNLQRGGQGDGQARTVA